MKLLRAILYPLYRFAFSHKNQIVIFQNSDDAKFLVNWGVVDSSKICLIRGSGVDIDKYQHFPEPKGKEIGRHERPQKIPASCRSWG